MSKEIPVAFGGAEDVKIPTTWAKTYSEGLKTRNESQVLNLSASEVDLEKAKKARYEQKQKALQKVRVDLGMLPQRHESELNEAAKLEKQQIDKKAEVSREHSFDDLISELGKAGIDKKKILDI